MSKPVLVILAAGMGSRYGGLKQIDPIDNDGHIIIDFSIYDANKAGFEKLVFIIKEENLNDFKEVIGDRISDKIEVEYAFQSLEDIPQGYELDDNREKPLGTAHAIYAARDKIDGPFVVINADDYYGRDAFKTLYDFLLENSDDDKYRYAMAGYRIENTVTDHGSVARGVCVVEDNHLVDINERTRIEKRDGKIEFTEDDGQTWTEIEKGNHVSMNMWAFTESYLKECEERLEEFLQNQVPKNPLKAEFLIPTVVKELLAEDKATVEVFDTSEKWYGVTYKEDKPSVVKAIQEMKDSGKYPQNLWS